jgi:hypothetical protein
MPRLISALIVLLLAGAVVAQTPTANVVGRVLDQSGATIPGARVSIREVETNQVREAATDGKGEYTVANLPPGEYRISVEKQGFRRLEEQGITLELDQTARLDLKLQVGAVAETVDVRASAPLLNTETAIKGDVIVSQEMVDVPLDGRDFGDLAYLVPGVKEKAQNASGSNFAVNGARSDNTK